MFSGLSLKNKTKYHQNLKKEERENVDIDKQFQSIFHCFVFWGAIFCGKKTKIGKVEPEAVRIFAAESWSYLHFNKKGEK